MKTSAIGVHDMLAVLGVDDVERRIRDVPGVESATVNFAAGNATVRYDETRLEIADIKSAVRQRGYQSASPAVSAGEAHESHTALDGSSGTHAPASPNTAPVAPPTAGAETATTAQQDKVTPSTMPKPSPVASAAAPAAPAGDDQQEKAAPHDN